MYHTGEGTYGTVVEDVLVKFLRGAVGNLMLYHRVVVHALHLVGYDTTVEDGLGVLSCQLHTAVVARVSVEEGQYGVAYTAVASLAYEHVAVARAHKVGFLYFVEVEAAVVGTVHLDDLIAEKLLVVGGVVGDDDVGLGTTFHNDEDAADGHCVLLALEDVVYLYGVVWTCVGRNVYEQGIHCQHSVECHHAVGAVCYIIIIRCDIDVCFAQGAIKLGALPHPGIQLYAVVGLEVAGHIGIFVSFYLGSGESLSGERAECLLAVRIHHGAGTLAYGFLYLGVELCVLVGHGSVNEESL